MVLSIVSVFRFCARRAQKRNTRADTVPLGRRLDCRPPHELPNTLQTQRKNNMSTHSCVLVPHLKSELATVADGKYGRMFASLPCYTADETALLALGRAHATIDSVLEPDTAGAATDNTRIPAG